VSFPGPSRGLWGQLSLAAWGANALLMSTLDWPLRYFSGGLLASRTVVVQSVKQTYDAKLGKELWEESARVLKLPIEVQR
jgi:hypothetical protein